MTVGELYKRLVLFSDELPPESYHSYYQKVKDTIKEVQEDFKVTDDLGECVKRWLGND